MKIIIVILTFSILLKTCFANEFGPLFYHSNKDHRVQILESGSEAFESKVQLIESAKESIDIEYFIFLDDQSSKYFAQKLIEKAKQKVKIRILLDGVMSRYTFNKKFSKYLVAHGIQVKYYMPISLKNITSPKRFHARNHRKMIIVDNKSVVIGGRNIANRYFNMDTKLNFLDRELVVHGEIVKKIKESFDSYWNFKRSKEVKLIKSSHWYFAHYKNILKIDEDYKGHIEQIRSIGKQELDQLNTYNCKNNEFVSDTPGASKKNKYVFKYLKETILGQIKKSDQASVLISVPYLVLQKPEKDFLNDITNYSDEFVILTNGLQSTDSALASVLFFKDLKKFYTQNMSIFVYNGQRPDGVNYKYGDAHWGLHGKTFLVNNNVSIVSSYNLDPRSRNINNELAYSCLDSQELNAQLRDNIFTRITYSNEIDHADPRYFTNGKKLSDGSSKTRKFMNRFLSVPFKLLKSQM